MKFPKKYTEHSIRTYTNKVFDLQIMNPESICLVDIAHGLSNTARFAAQLNGFLSVAQHSCLVASEVPDNLKLAALLHDASEAYLGDMPTPFKKLMPDFKKHEVRLMKIIANKYGFEYPLNPIIKAADQKLLSVEWNECVVKDNSAFYWTPKQAKEQFLKRYYEYLDLSDTLKMAI
jgi:hypothetical protein